MSGRERVGNTGKSIEDDEVIPLTLIDIDPYHLFLLNLKINKN